MKIDIECFYTTQQHTKREKNTSHKLVDLAWNASHKYSQSCIMKKQNT